MSPQRGNRGDANIQMRVSRATEAQIEDVAMDRGMKKRDLVGRLVNWFVSLDKSLQACILGHLSKRGEELILLDRLRELKVGQSPSATRAAETARRRTGPGSRRPTRTGTQ